MRHSAQPITVCYNTHKTLSTLQEGGARMAVYYTSVSVEVDPMAHDVYGLPQSLPHLLDALEDEPPHLGSPSSRIHLRGHDATFLNAHFLFLCDGNDFDAGDLVRQVLHEAPHKVSHFTTPVNVHKRNDWLSDARKQVIQAVSERVSPDATSLDGVGDILSEAGITLEE